MRVVHVSDLHVTEGPRLADQVAMLEAITDNAASSGVDLWLVTGDLFGRTVPHRSTPAERNALYPAIVRMAELAPVVVIYGNHDHDPDLDTLSCLGGDWPVQVVKGAQVLVVNTKAGRAHCYCLAYPTKRWLLAGEETPPGVDQAQQMVQEKLRSLFGLWGQRIRRQRRSSPADVHLLLAHVQVRGCATSGGEVLAGQEIEITRADLDGLPVDYGALGHLHLNQEVGLRSWYAGSPWRNDYGERDPKGYLVVDVGRGPGLSAYAGGMPVGRYAATVERAEVIVTRVVTPCRRFVTLDWRWAADREDGEPRWVVRPPEEAMVHVPEAEVRCRLVVPQQWVAGCPWEAELERVRAAGALRLQVERKIEPTLRVREHTISADQPLPEKVRAYWKGIGTEPLPIEQEAALSALQDLQTREDPDIQQDTQAILG